MLFEEASWNDTFYNESIGSYLDSSESARDPLLVIVPVTLIYILILASGIVGNVSTCIVIARNKYMHTATNYYLFSLAISDLLLLLSGLPQEIYLTWSRYPYVFGEMFCIVRGFAAETSTNATVLTITAFTIERYVAICHPFVSHTESNLSRAFKYIIIIWVVSSTLAFPQAIQMGLIYGKDENGLDLPETSTCAITNQLPYAFEISSIVFFLVPWTLIVILYILIGLKLYKSKRTSNRTISSSHCRHSECVNSTNNRATSRVVKMLVAVVVAFFVCWAPFQAHRLLAVYGDSQNEQSKRIFQWLTYVSGILYYLSATINPLLYNLMSYKFRNAFKETWSTCKGTGSLSPDHSMPNLDYKWQRRNSHSRSFSSSHFDEGNSMRRIMVQNTKTLAPNIINVTETDSLADDGCMSNIPIRFSRKTIFRKPSIVKEDTALDSTILTDDGVLTNNNRPTTTTLLMTPN